MKKTPRTATARAAVASSNSAPTVAEQLGLRPGQSLQLLQALHILTRDGKLNQDSRRKLKQVYHLFQFIEPLLQELAQDGHAPLLADHGAGKSYLGFILYDLFFKDLGAARFTALKPVRRWCRPRSNWPRSWALRVCTS